MAIKGKESTYEASFISEENSVCGDAPQGSPWMMAYVYRSCNPQDHGTRPKSAPAIKITLGDAHPSHYLSWWGVLGAPQLTKERVYCKKSSLCCYRVGDCQEVGPRPNS